MADVVNGLSEIINLVLRSARVTLAGDLNCAVDKNNRGARLLK